MIDQFAYFYQKQIVAFFFKSISARASSIYLSVVHKKPELAMEVDGNVQKE